ncbi:hypothetical protein FRB91_011934 [Serendipita sp. 411]|nr:hypothetical protein FRB91_011934 [Serendipita sp. 411]
MSIVFSRPKNNVVAGDQARRRVSSNPPLSLPLYSIVHLCTGRSKTTKPSKNNRFLPLLWSGYSDDYDWSTKEQKGRKCKPSSLYKLNIAFLRIVTEPDVVRLHPDATPKTPPIARDPFSSSQGLKV